MKGSKSKSGAKQTDSKPSMRTAIRIRSPNKRKSKSGAKISDSKPSIRNPNKRKSKSVRAKQSDSKLLVRMSSRKPNKPKWPKLPVEPAPDFVIYADESGFHERFRKEHPDIKSFAVADGEASTDMEDDSDSDSELEDLLFDDDFVCVQLLPKTF